MSKRYRLIPLSHLERRNMQSRYGDDIPFKRMQAISDFDMVRTGDLGGMVSGSTLGDDVWIEKDGVVIDSTLQGRVQIKGRSLIQHSSMTDTQIKDSNIFHCDISHSSLLGSRGDASQIKHSNLHRTSTITDTIEWSTLRNAQSAQNKIFDSEISESNISESTLKESVLSRLSMSCCVADHSRLSDVDDLLSGRTFDLEILMPKSHMSDADRALDHAGWVGTNTHNAIVYEKDQRITLTKDSIHSESPIELKTLALMMARMDELSESYNMSLNDDDLKDLGLESLEM